MKFRLFEGRLLNLLICLLLSFSIISCKGSSSSSDDDKATANVKTGIFIDDIVVGAYYKSGGQEGTTNANGEFKYEAGREVVFSLGDVELGRGFPQETGSANAKITPLDLVPDASADDKDSIVNNMVRLLMSIDSDGNPDNGITIEAEVAKAFEGKTVNFTESSSDFENSFVANMQPELRKVDGYDTLTLKTKAEADTHFKKSLEDQGIVPRPIVKERTVKHDKDFDITIKLPEIADASIDIYYTLDGTEPSDASTKYTIPIKIAGEKAHILRAIAFNPKTNTQSDIVTVEYLIEYPVIGIPAFNLSFLGDVLSKDVYKYDDGAMVQVSSSTAGATIYYTFDGSNPGTKVTGATKEAYGGVISFLDESFDFRGNTTVKAIAVKDSFSSVVATKTFNFKPEAPKFNWNSDTKKLTITSKDGETIYYTTNGDAPTSSSTRYVAAIDINAKKTVKAIVVKAKVLPSDVTSQEIDPDAGTPLAKPTLDYESLDYSGANSAYIELKLPADKDIKIYYTTDGTEPTTASKLCDRNLTDAAQDYYKDTNDTFVVYINNSPTIVKAIAVKTGRPSSEILEKEFKLALSTPQLEPIAGMEDLFSGNALAIDAEQKITIKPAAQNKDLTGLKFYYSTTNENVPINPANLYSAPFSLDLSSGDVTVWVIAVKDGWKTSSKMDFAPKYKLK